MISAMVIYFSQGSVFESAHQKAELSESLTGQQKSGRNYIDMPKMPYVCKLVGFDIQKMPSGFREICYVMICNGM